MKKIPNRVKQIYDSLHSIDKEFLAFGIISNNISDKHELSGSEKRALKEMAGKNG